MKKNELQELEIKRSLRIYDTIDKFSDNLFGLLRLCITGYRGVLLSIVLLAYFGGLSPFQTFSLLKLIVENISQNTTWLVWSLIASIIANLGFIIAIVVMRVKRIKPLSEENALLKRQKDPQVGSSNLKSTGVSRAEDI